MSFDVQSHCYSTNGGTGEECTRKFIKQRQKMRLK